MAIPEDKKNFYKYTADHPFAVMYPLLAKEFVEKCAVTKGRCLDIGTGSGALSIELSKITDLEILALDVEPEVIELAKQNCVQHAVPDGRIQFITAPVESIPLPDESVDLIFSRGSIPFWKDHLLAFKEIYRILAVGGQTMVGCGFSRYQTLEEVKAMRPVWEPKVLEERTSWKKGTFLTDTLNQAGIKDYNILNDGYGTWVEIHKSRSNG